jgi:hypothetical protein
VQWTQTEEHQLVEVVIEDLGELPDGLLPERGLLLVPFEARQDGR